MVVNLEKVWEAKNRTRVLMLSAGLILTVAVVDWWTKPYVSLGFLYLFPIMLSAGFLPRWVIALIGLGCAMLAELFSSLIRSYTRLSLEMLALIGCGLFAAELVRNRRLAIEAQHITSKGQERLRALIETSPAAIVTIDNHGLIEMANRAADELLMPREGQLIGSPIAAFLPELHHAIRWEEAPQFRTSMQCHAHRGSGESFTADVWFSTYKEGIEPKLAAIIVDVTRESVDESIDSAPGGEQASIPLRARELDVTRLLVQGLTNKQIAASMDISESAVKNTLQHLFSKTGVRTRSQLVRMAIEQYRNLL